MILIKVIYDKYNRTFKLLDAELESALEDGAVYELEVPVVTDECPESEDTFIAAGTPLAHA